MLVQGKHYNTIWMEEGVVRMINQPLLPHKFDIYNCRNHKETAEAITNMVVRGAGAIGSAGGYALAQGVLEAPDEGFEAYVEEAFQTIRNTRPTAQNLFYALERVKRATFQALPSCDQAREAAVKEAGAIALEDLEACKKIGEIGESLIQDGFRILTHCNAGWLAFTDWGSALSPIYQARRKGKNLFVWVDETRPRCQGGRLTAWELMGEDVPCAVIADNSAGYYMYRGEVDMVIVGSDRIARNGDVANKIGTYEKAVLAGENNIPFYVAAPSATIDWDCPSGKEIPIEERNQDEVLGFMGRTGMDEVVRVWHTPRNAKARNPAFDVTPARYITGIITEKGIMKPGELENFR